MIQIKRTFPAPTSLAIEAEKALGNYSCEDVVEQLRKDFYNKCYICEMKDLQDPQVEHLRPHKNGKYKEKKFDWENLFWSCGHCNGIKNKDEYDETIIDCCKEDPEEKIYFRLLDNNIEVLAKEQTELTYVETAKLVYEAFNVKNTGMRIYKSDMRLKKLMQEMNILYECLKKYKDGQNLKILYRQLKVVLSRQSDFAAFKRCYIRDNISQYPQLEEYIK